MTLPTPNVYWMNCRLFCHVLHLAKTVEIKQGRVASVGQSDWVRLHWNLFLAGIDRL